VLLWCLCKEFGADANQADKNGWTPVHFAAKEGHADVVRQCKELGADINVTDIDGWTPVHLAARKGYAEVVRIAESSAPTSTLLSTVAGRSHISQPVKAMPSSFACKELGTDINLKDEDGRSPVHYAANNGHAEVVRVLIECGVDVNLADRNGVAPLHFASVGGFTEIVCFLITSGADVTKMAKDGHSALSIVSKGMILTLQYPLQHGGADIAMVFDGRSVWNLLHPPQRVEFQGEGCGDDRPAAGFGATRGPSQ
jgi:ankyrin repeat protein